MKMLCRKAIATGLCLFLIVMPNVPSQAQAPASTIQQTSQLPIHEYLQKPYAELFELAPSLTFSAAEVEQERQALKRGEDACRKRFKDDSKQYGKQLDVTRKELKSRGLELKDQPRHELHCKIQNLELLRSEAEVLSGQAIPNAYDNLQANRDRGRPHGPSPPTPPYKRVRIRRFDRLIPPMTLTGWIFVIGSRRVGFTSRVSTGCRLHPLPAHGDLPKQDG